MTCSEKNKIRTIPKRVASWEVRSLATRSTAGWSTLRCRGTWASAAAWWGAQGVMTSGRSSPERRVHVESVNGLPFHTWKRWNHPGLPFAYQQRHTKTRLYPRDTKQSLKRYSWIPDLPDLISILSSIKRQQIQPAGLLNYQEIKEDFQWKLKSQSA